jgi:hypothetical protein
MTRYIFLPDEKNGKQVLDGKRGNLITITDSKTGVATNLTILTVKPEVTDYVAPASSAK